MNALQAQVYVDDLPASVDVNYVKNLFQECGTILDVILEKHKDGTGASAYVTFDSRESAAQAINDINYTKLNGVPIRITWSDPETRKIIASGEGNLFIRGLDESIEVSQLHEAFANFGDVISCKIPLTNGKSRGYAYIQFRNPEDADRARIDLADACINGKPITIEKYVHPKKQAAETFTNVYIKNLPATIDTDEKLRTLFEKFGEIKSTNLPLTGEGKPKGYAFCNFAKHEDAVKAVEVLNDTTIEGMKEGVKLVVTCAIPKKGRARL